MNGKLILSVLLALVLVGAAVTIVNAQDQSDMNPAATGIDRDSARDLARDQALSGAQDETPRPLKPIPASGGDHSGGDEDQGEDEGDGNESGDPQEDPDRGPGDQPPQNETGGNDHCDCPDSGPQGQGADMTVEKTGEVHQVNETHADRVRFVVTVENIGVFTSFNVGVADQLPDLGSEWHVGGQDGSLENCQISADNLATCEFGHLEPGESRQVVFSAFDCVIGCGPIDNEARVFSDNDDNPDNNRDQASVERPPCPADIGVRKQGEVVLGQGDPEAFDDFVFFFIDLKNFGTGPAHNVTLHDELPDLHGSQWTVSGEGADECVITQNVLTCNFGTLESGESRHLELESSACHVNCAEEITNTVTVSSDNDENPENDDHTITLTAPDCPDAAVSKEASVTDNPEPEPDTVSYTFTVTSVGDATVENVVLHDQLFDFGVEWRLSGRDAFDCTIDAENVLTCHFGDLRPGAERVVTVTAESCDIGCGEDIVNLAHVEADNDQNPNNDHDEAVVPRDPCPEDQETGQKEDTS